MLNDPDKLEELILFQRGHAGFCERLLGHCYDQVLAPGDNFIDVGARVGHHLMPMARKVGPTGHGIGIEASPAVAQALSERIAASPDLASRIQIVAGAAADREGHATFYVRETFSGWSSLYAEHVHPGEAGEEVAVEVPFVQIDDVVAQAGWTSCGFIKLDIEHAEFPAMRSAKKMLKAMRPVLCFENAPRIAADLNGYKLAEFAQFFDDLGYDLYDIFLNRMTRQRLVGDKLLPSYYMAWPSERGALSDQFIASADAAAQDFMTKKSAG